MIYEQTWSMLRKWNKKRREGLRNTNNVLLKKIPDSICRGSSIAVEEGKGIFVLRNDLLAKAFLLIEED